jgi:hypothetical protein
VSCFVVRTLSPFFDPTRGLTCDLGDLVWAHEEAKQLLHGLAEVVVSGSFVRLRHHSLSKLPHFFSVAHGFP